MSKSKEKFVKSIVFGDNQWFDKYLNICRDIYSRGSDESDLYLDVLKDLCTDTMADNVVIHLLSLLEQMVPLLDNSDKVEQTVGSLIYIYNASRKSDSIRQKYLITTTVIITYHSEMSETNSSLRQLYDSVIQLLIKNSENTKTIIGLVSSQCLREIGNTSADLLIAAHHKNHLKRPQTSVLTALLANNQCTPEDVANILSHLANLSPLESYQTLSALLAVIRSNQFKDLLSPMIFKPYLAKLTLSSEVHNFHFALQLLLSFGLELFSTVEEQRLLKQMVTVGTHPSLSIAHRLLALDYAKSIAIRLKSSAFDWSSIQITAFDGPDTQEKKLTILNETQIDSHYLLVQFKPLRTLSLGHNLRAINAFYRIIYSFLTKRPEILNEIQEILTFFIFKSPDPHIKRSISLFNACKNLAKGTTRHLIKNLSNLSESETFKSLSEFMEFIICFEWIFKQNDLELSEDQLVFLLTIIGNNCKRWPESCGRALDCCSAVLYYQTITTSVKQTLLSILQWLMSHRKNDLSVTSLAQIYILALNTLEGDENIKRVFKFDDHISLDTVIIEDLSTDVPFVLKRLPNTQSAHQRLGLDEIPFSLDIFFEIYILEEYKQRFDHIFGLILYFDTSDGSSSLEYEIPFLECSERQTFGLKLRSTISKPFQLTISAIFNNSVGTNFRCDRFQTETISLRDILIPVDINEKPFEDLCQSVIAHKDGMQTVVCRPDLHSIEDFLSQFQWFAVFLIAETNRFVCGTAPDRLVLGVIEKVNNFINLFLYTNNYELLPNIYHKLMENVD